MNIFYKVYVEGFVLLLNYRENHLPVSIHCICQFSHNIAALLNIDSTTVIKMKTNDTKTVVEGKKLGGTNANGQY